jgi:hypothetical protein
MLHANNGHPHKSVVSQQFMDRNAMAIAVPPSYSPDLAPSDFYLFARTVLILRFDLEMSHFGAWIPLALRFHVCLRFDSERNTIVSDFDHYKTI